MYVWDVKSLIHMLGGQGTVAETHAALSRECGYRPLSINTINSWVSKNYIRGSRLPELLHVADALGINFDIRKAIHVAS